MPEPDSLILVAILPKPRDLEIARVLGWYRIPLRRAPKVIAVDFLAFYQPGSFGSRGGRIEYLAAVRGHELTTRAALLRDQAEHPHAREEYYKLQLGPLELLPKPVRSGSWKRISFFYTTGEYLVRAATIDDLVVEEGDRNLLWHTLRERAAATRQYQVSQIPPDLPIDPELLAMLGLLPGGPRGAGDP